MAGWQEFTAERLRGELRCDATNIRATSSGLGWSSAYASLQREQPFEANLSTIDDCLMILHRSGPATVTFRLGGDRAVSQLRRRGQISVIPGACGGYLNLRTPHDTLHVYLKSELFIGSGPELAPMLGIEDSILENLAAAITESVTDPLPRSSLYVDPIAHAIVGRILDITGRAPKYRNAERLSNAKLSRIREFVEEHLEQDIRIADLAAACGIGAKHLKRSFQASMGTTPYQYVVSRRVERAKRLLAERSIALAEIALRSGFCHQEHLTRVFRAVTGQSPGRYRRGRE
ncbi:AraC family transcriptional regulator [Streptomyces sp. AcH 505]|uniref:helix-turn-helix domain-containing protein n=1 Tax=Streptomyces sp. AcH 505 TaxID=352211 RepID=UPI0012FF3132